MENKHTLKMSDMVAAHIAQLLQLSIILGEDIMDYFRLMRFIETDGVLNLDSSYSDEIEIKIQNLVKKAEEQLKIESEKLNNKSNILF